MANHNAAVTTTPESSASLKAKQTLLERAQKLFAEHEVAAGFATLEDAEKIFPDDPQVLVQLGKYLAEHKSPPLGIAKLKQALEINPDYVPALMELGSIYLKPGDVIHANTYYGQALSLAPKDPSVHVSIGSLHQRKGDLPAAIAEYRAGIELQLKYPKIKPDVPEKKPFRTVDAEKMLWDTLRLMADNGVHMFPVFGTTLGLVRNGHLLEHDKDVDTGVPFTEVDRAIRILSHHGWTEICGSFGYMNPRALLNKGLGLSMDISGFVIDEKNGKALTAGAWMKGVPKEWNLIFEFGPVELERRETPDGAGRAWRMKNPEAFLACVYGEEWRVPDKNFDTMICGKNTRGFPLMMQCFAYARIFEHWTKGNKPRAMALARHTLERNPNDSLVKKVLTKLRQQ